MSINYKEKELVAVGASVAAGCKPCTNYHFKKVRKAGTSDEEIKQAISDAICVRNSAKEIMEAHGLKHLGIEKNINDCGCNEETTRIKELVSVSAAFAVNCTSNLEKHINAALNVGITDEEIKLVLDFTLLIKDKAALHVDRIVERIGNNLSSVKQTEDTGGCGCDDDLEAATIGSSKGSTVEMAVLEEEDCGCGGDC